MHRSVHRGGGSRVVGGGCRIRVVSRRGGGSPGTPSSVCGSSRDGAPRGRAPRARRKRPTRVDVCVQHIGIASPGDDRFMGASVRSAFVGAQTPRSGGDGARDSRDSRGRVANPARGRTRGDRARGCRVRTRAVLRARPTAAVGSDGASRARETRAVFASTAEVSGGGGGTPRRAPRAEPGDAPRGGARDARAGCRPAPRDARDGGHRV